MSNFSITPAVGGETSGKLFVSRYNHFVKHGEGVLGYNARTRSFGLLADDVAKALQGDGLVDRIRDADLLIELGFLHRGEESERMIERYRPFRVETISCS